MNWKKTWLSSLTVALLGLSVVQAQNMNLPSSPLGQSAPAASMLPSQPGDPAVMPPGQEIRLSSWILGDHWPGCCNPYGGNGPLGYEMYIRSGISFPIGGGALNNSISTGWDIEGGGRLLLFNRADDAAWTVDLSVTNIFNQASKTAPTVTLSNVPLKAANAQGGVTTTTVPTIDVTPGNLNSTFVNLSGGREIWLLGTADSSHNDLNWRIGWDVGGRWGTEDLELDQLQHRTCAVGGVFMSLHSDVEVPCGACILQAGIRSEFGFTFGDILQRTNDGNTSEVNLMLTFGVRF